MTVHWSPSKYLFQAAPPDMAEGSLRWTFAIYEILDTRDSAIEPRVCHATYLAVVELNEKEVGDPTDPLFTVKLEDTIVKKWKKQR